jgi:RNA polymerase sigma factor (sigma-70 family)
MDDAEAILDSLSRPEAFAQLFDEYFSWLYGFCSRRVGALSAEDVVGETFRKAFERRHQFDTARPSARPWLIAIALNIIRNESRRQERERSAVSRSSREPAAPDSLDILVTDSLDAKALLERIQRRLMHLPRVEYESLTLFVWDELSYEEIAEVTAVPVGTVRSRIHRARQRLLVSLETAAGSHSGSVATDWS